MKAEIKVPAVGESITEATIAEWVKKNGDFVNRDDVLLVLETDKASVEVVAENAGILSTLVEEGDTVQIGAVVGSIDTSAKGAPTESSSESSTETSSKKDTPKDTSTSENAAESQNKKNPTSAHPELQKHLSPATKKIVEENQLQPENITGSGRGGRITKQDAVNAVGSTAGTSKESSSTTAKMTTPIPKSGSNSVGTEKVTREPMTRLRQTIAKRLVEAQHTAAILTTFNEIDMSAAMALRKKYNEIFEKKHGVKLGFMGLFVKASIEALKAFPKVNASIEGSDILYKSFNNIGIAVGTEKGLLVPIIKNAQNLSVADIELTIKHYANKARDGKISIDDLSDGTFTISNGGVYGSLMSTPILNPPQSGILGLHKIEERPIALNGQVVIKPMMYVALSYDHRIIDGSESVQFLVKIKECMEDPARMLLEI